MDLRLTFRRRKKLGPRKDNPNKPVYDSPQQLAYDQLALNVVRDQLTFPYSLIGDNELNLLVQMDTRLSVIKKRMLLRILLLTLTTFIGLFMGLLLFRKYVIYLTLVGILAGAIFWFVDISVTSQYYRRFRLQRQIAFSQFVRLAAAYLPELEKGVNLFSIFQKISTRLTYKSDRAALLRLMVNMQLDPNNEQPFLDFAHAFSVADRAELIMLTIHSMYIGNVDPTNIQDLANDSNEDMLKQIDSIIVLKIAKFSSIPTKLGLLLIVVMIPYFGSIMVNTFISSFKDLHFGESIKSIT